MNAGCLAEQSTDAYLDYVGKLHTHYADFSGEARRLLASFKKLDQLAEQEAGVDQRTLSQCIVKQDDRRVRASITEGEKLGVQSLPTIFVNGEKLVGAQPVESIWAAIDRALKSQGIAPPAG